MTSTHRGRLFALSSTVALGVAVQLAPVQQAAAEVPTARIVREPPAALLRGTPAAAGQSGPSLMAATPLKARPQTSSAGTEVFYDLHIDKVQSTLYNPDTGQDDEVELRAYKGEAVDPQIPYIGPKVELWPGETFRLTLHNDLDANDPSCVANGEHNGPHCFNSTNMHTHGLWVSPAGNSDNVLLKIAPQTSFQYEYNVPADHPAGTFWYHPHLHGSTALQVSSGMAGPLIIRGDRLPQAKGDGSLVSGDLDTLLTEPNGEALRERVLVFQQIAYACRDQDGNIKKDAAGKWVCDKGDVGGIESYKGQFGITPTGGTEWNASGRRTAINGLVEPYVVGARAGNVERWRFIHAGVRDSIRLSFRKLDPAQVAATPGKGQKAREQFIQQACTGAPLAQFAVASDGLTRGAVSRRDTTVFQPGYREDLLMVFPEPGTYCIVDETLRPEQSVNNESYPRELLGYVTVDGSAAGKTPEAVLAQALETAAKARMPQGKVRDKVLADLADGLKLSAFAPHADIAANDVTGHRSLGFQIVLPPGQPPVFEVGEIGTGSDGKPVPINSSPYEPGRLDRLLELGAVDEWKLTAFAFGHPFHIHVNPFQIVSVKDPEGNEVSGAPVPDANGIPSQYANLQGTWRDTLFLQQGYTATVRSRYRRYIGDFVLHCHILDHEDEGMMQNVRIALPGTENSGMPMAHH
ncbi:Multicopper oxidase with three cupredoxin domains (includes cell division protein FtsP and spore coat protein CotA) [Azotobacter beijerinckii]|uniref:Multicopper oxidase with three cupredoxin domains (Includes cell division protein FtsP and spore coat protein CotA) n=1 Tax=Azotobacter beijerinckii TaxID=170623 RepID=A0A1H6XSQ5_9GAMM|nr:multicopper oxidase family protein [Azotobacter beijerinckii]SEJ31226.1 Multicopper oxidase with three cupredoxin domains (includes cell division protein FtsP and spore coat protein CotA) [Azotobacter beijerinckii]